MISPSPMKFLIRVAYYCRKRLNRSATGIGSLAHLLGIAAAEL